MYTDANIVLNQNENSLLRQYYNVNADFYFPVCVSGENKQQIGLNPYCGNKKHILFVWHILFAKHSGPALVL